MARKGGMKGRKWQSARCSMSGKPYVAASESERYELGKPPGQQKCPRCQRYMFVNEKHKWPTHGAIKCSWGYGE